MAAGGNALTLGAFGQNVTGGAGADTVVGGALALTGTLNGAGGSNTLSVGGGTLGAALISNFQTLSLTDNENISAANGGGASGATTLTMTDSDTLTMTVAQNQGLSGTATVGGTGQAVILTNNGTITGIAGIETYNLANGDNTFTFSTTTTQTANGNGGVDTFIMGGNATASGVNGADVYQVVSGTNNVISALGYNNSNDIVQVSAGATATSTVAASWTSGAGTFNNGTITLTVLANVDVSNATGSTGWALNGNANPNSITGSAQADTITGGDGADSLTGGLGNDVYSYLSVNNSAASVANNTTRTFDVFNDFASVSDKINIAAINATLTGGAPAGSVAITVVNWLNDIGTSVNTFQDMSDDLLGGLVGSSGAGIKAYIFDLSGSGGALQGKYLLLNNNDTDMTTADVMIQLSGTSNSPIAGDFILA